MRTITFTIIGNQESKTGNPIPYLRTTQKSQWTKKAQRYQAWKSFVVSKYIDALRAMPFEQREKFGKNNDLAGKKPIAKTNGKMWMELKITFSNNAHADCDNIFKGIADALFMQDKFLAGSFDYKYGQVGSVEVLITFT